MPTSNESVDEEEMGKMIGAKSMLESWFALTVSDGGQGKICWVTGIAKKKKLFYHLFDVKPIKTAVVIKDYTNKFDFFKKNHMLLRMQKPKESVLV